MHKKGAHFPFHALLRSPSKGLCEYTEKENAPLYGHISTHMSFAKRKLLDVFRRNDLLALMLNWLRHSVSATAVYGNRQVLQSRGICDLPIRRPAALPPIKILLLYHSAPFLSSRRCYYTIASAVCFQPIYATDLDAPLYRQLAKYPRGIAQLVLRFTVATVYNRCLTV